MNTNNDAGIDAYYLAELAAQVMCRQRSPRNAVETAWQLVEEAKDKLEDVRLTALAKTPEALAEWEEWRAEQLEKLRYCYRDGVKKVVFSTIKGERLDRAEGCLRKFLEWKARGRGEKDPEAWTQAKILLYRNRGFSGTEVTKLQAEFNHWQNKGAQGRLRRPASDERLRKVKQAKLEKKGKEAYEKLRKPKIDAKAYLRALGGQNASFDGVIFPDQKSDNSRRPPDETAITSPGNCQNTA